MKFGKSLSNQIEETLPEWREKFLSYKGLKKRLKGIGAADRPTKKPRLHPVNNTNRDTVVTPCGAEAGGGGDRTLSSTTTAMTREEEDFLKVLEAELEKFNAFFVEKEEEYIIRQKELQDRIAMAMRQNSQEELLKVRKEIVDFHGEMVLLENYSALNYTGIVKILKKYDKRTGALIRLPFIQKVLQQPFFTTDLLYKLVKKCEVMLDSLFPKKSTSSISSENGIGGNIFGSGGESAGDKKPSTPGSSSLSTFGVPELEEIEYMESLYMKSTIAALRALKEIRSGSSTTSVFSLPPLQSSGVDEGWKNVPVLEQAAK